MELGAVGDVVKNGKRKRCGQGKDHSDSFAQRIDRHALNGFSVEKDFAFPAKRRVIIVEAVQGPEKRGLSAVGRADDAENFIGADFKVDVLEYALGLVMHR